MIIPWIDDTPQRQKSADRLREVAGSEFSIEFKCVKDDLNSVIENLLRKKTSPGLVVIDHILDKTPKTNFIRAGSSVAELIRQAWPQCPIVGVTAGEIDQHQEASYDEVFKDSSLDLAAYESILTLARDSSKLRKLTPFSLSKLFRKIKAPKLDEPRLGQAVPDVLKLHPSDQWIIGAASRWVRHQLLSQPGFLYDQEWCANFIGIKPSAFERAEAYLRPAKYSGVFQDRNQPRWWAQTLREIVFKLSPASHYSWEAGRDLARIRPADYSSCYQCGRPFPETLGRIDAEDTKRWVPLHLRCSAPHPKHTKVPFFDEIRVMLPG